MKCAHCGSACDGKFTLSVHVVNLRVNMWVSPWSFCCPEHRLAWFDAATADDLLPVTDDPGEAHQALHTEDVVRSGTLLALIVHHDGDHSAFEVRLPTAPLPSMHSGRVVAHHQFHDPHHVNQWWRGDLEAPALPMGSADPTHWQVQGVAPAEVIP
jgi:hypothetical protein